MGNLGSLSSLGVTHSVPEPATMRTLFTLTLCCLLAQEAFAESEPIASCNDDEAISTIRDLKERLNFLIEGLKRKAEIGGFVPKATKATPETTTPTEEIILPTIPRDCKDIQVLGNTDSGVYTITPVAIDTPVDVFCDMDTEGGGWTVIQRRTNGNENFDRTFAEYARGFGTVDAEMWIGNDILATMTITKPYELYITMTDFDDDIRFAKYGIFAVKGAEKNYALTIGDYTGTAGNSMGYHNGAKFSTIDVDNDASSSRSCAEVHRGGWWFKNCLRANLNGLYLGGDHDSYADGIEWSRFRGLKYSLKETIMMIRPILTA